MNKIDKGVRATNYFIDLFVIYAICFVIILLDRSLIDFLFLFYIIMFLYYFLMELFTKQTLGKMITKTKVVHKDGSSANWLKILMRSFWRLIPFDSISYLFGTEVGMHDKLSTTRLIKQIK